MSNYQKYQNNLSFRNKLGRLLWSFTWMFFFRPLNLPVFNGFRIFLLRIFGSKIGKGCKVNATIKVWAPWNLEMGNLVAIGFGAMIYNPGKISIGSKVTVSQRTHLCSATHDYTLPSNPLVTKPIRIEDRAWVAADAFVGPGVVVGEGGIVGARAAVFRDVFPWTIVGGNPAKFIKDRVLEGEKTVEEILL
ncbi:putative colanic acid biosynthesis acetyltransferase [Echinicola strongylocentroti]|uniref:Putative colanic acid biosynthesis acetyltransferase n=1 Tax=Echinicola strongylocentroti TaxID=1795355 RepID=A0A2Z4IPL5_9BACT|nr:putative colanic acid biosynthesis acetyltransferase [Echinicola strongylocentroti]AWW32588.1 putative colanic acid biosynthesis acetyltransferase [Echinicola strongylocentroti]